MGAIHEFEPEKLIVGVIYHEPCVLEAAMARLVAEFGEVEDCSEEFSSRASSPPTTTARSEARGSGGYTASSAASIPRGRRR